MVKPRLLWEVQSGSRNEKLDFVHVCKNVVSNSLNQLLQGNGIVSFYGRRNRLKW